MNIAIYQIAPDRDENNVAFLNYENLERFQGSAALRSEIYDKVFEGEVECGTLEEVYQMFNLDHPDGYRGRSLSVSDVVEVVGEEKSTFHFCDSIGFREVDFDPDMTEPLKEKKIKVVLCEPGKVARVAEIGTELSDLQRVVGGLIEPYYPFEEQVCIVCNDEGKYNGMRPCRAIYGEDREMIPQNVAMKVDRPRKNSFQPTFLDAEQMQKLFEVVKGTRLELPVLVAAFYGLRRGEVLGLKWDAIDFNRGTLTIKRTVTEATIDGTMKIIEQDSAKTKSSLRTLPLVGSFRDYFQKVKEAQELNKKVCGNCYNYDYDGYVFVNELGERMRPNYLTEYFPKYIAKHGMPKMRFHDLRHSCASLLLANGVPLKQIQEWLGHSDFSTTANIYAHLDYRSKISSAQAMEQGMLLPRSDDFGSRWENVTEQGKITEPDLNPVF